MNTFLQDFRRVSRREPCIICEKPDGCAVRVRDGRPACIRVESNRPLATTPPSWLHGDDSPDWRDALWQETPRAISDSIMESPPPPPDPTLVDRGLSALLAACPLTDDHRTQLHHRGLSDEEIATLPVGSLPEPGEARDHAAGAIVAAMGETAYGAIPGLYRRVGRPALAGAPGLLIGVRQRDRLVGAQIRPDMPTSGKYVWLSSPPDTYRDGRGSGAPCAALTGDAPEATSEATSAIVVEGILKGLIVNVRTGRPVVAMPGASITSAVTGHLGELGATTALLAYDSDRYTNPAVAGAEASLIAALDAAGYPTLRLTWPPRFKGLDDALAARRIPIAEPVASPPATPPEDPERVAHAERLAREAEARRVRLTKAVQATGLAAPEKQSLIALFTHLDGARKDAPDLAEIPVPNAHIAEHIGVSDQTAGRHLAACQRLARADTGEVVELYRRRTEFDPERRRHVTLYTPRLSYDDLLDLLPAAVPLAKDGTAKPKRGHGGPGRRFCPDHPTARIIRRVTYHCGECDREVDRGSDTTADPAETPRAISDSIMESPPPGTSTGEETPSRMTPPLVPVISASNLESRQIYASLTLDGDEPAWLADAPAVEMEPDPDDATDGGEAGASSVGEAWLVGASWPGLAAAGEPLAQADQARNREQLRRATEDLAAHLAPIARARGRTPVPKPRRDHEERQQAEGEQEPPVNAEPSHCTGCGQPGFKYECPACAARYAGSGVSA